MRGFIKRHPVSIFELLLFPLALYLLFSYMQSTSELLSKKYELGDKAAQYILSPVSGIVSFAGKAAEGITGNDYVKGVLDLVGAGDAAQQYGRDLNTRLQAVKDRVEEQLNVFKTIMALGAEQRQRCLYAAIVLGLALVAKLWSWRILRTVPYVGEVARAFWYGIACLVVMTALQWIFGFLMLKGVHWFGPDMQFFSIRTNVWAYAGMGLFKGLATGYGAATLFEGARLWLAGRRPAVALAEEPPDAP